MSNKDKIIVYNKTIDKECMIHKNELELYIQNGYVKGRRPFTEEQS